MSFLNTTDKTHHVSHLPPGTNKATAIGVLQDHEAMIRFGPHMKEFKQIDDDPARPGANVYTVTDIMDMLPKGLWSSNVVSTYCYTNTERGVDMVIKAPLDVLMETHWTIQEQGEALVLDEDVTMTCSRLLIGTVKGQCDGNYAEIHRKFAERVTQLQGGMAGP